MNETLSQKELITLLIDLSGGVNRCPHTEISQEEMCELSLTVTRGTTYETVFISPRAAVETKHALAEVAPYKTTVAKPLSIDIVAKPLSIDINNR